MLSAQDKYWVVWAERAIDLRGRSRNNTRGAPVGTNQEGHGGLAGREAYCRRVAMEGARAM